MKQIEKKFRLLEYDCEYLSNNRILYRIEAIRDFDDVKKGDLGGYVQYERNLSHEGNCWIYQNAKAVDSSVVFENGKMYDESGIAENARLYGSAKTKDSTMMIQYVDIFGEALIKDSAVIGGKSKVYGNAIIEGKAAIDLDSEIFGNAIVRENSYAYGAIVYDNAILEGHVTVNRQCRVYGTSTIRGRTKLLPLSRVCGTKERPEIIDIQGEIQTCQGAGLVLQQGTMKPKKKLFR